MSGAKGGVRVAAAGDTTSRAARESGAESVGTLFVVATPIGNMGDITLRAIEVLRSVALVAAEDTRLTRRLWARHGIETRLVSFHARSGEGRRDELLARLAAGDDVALVTDAGTPLVSDPGADLVAAWLAVGGRVVPVPGASAVLAALVAAGLPAARWSFEGFLPRRGRERRERLARVAADERATVLFEAPGRVAATLADLAAA
ncbi:MAG TPA: 16S rRNA (cytidine(1402)-2'-O)-methyltransferase, partial [Candidatus Limnocylindrales bacterium]